MIGWDNASKQSDYFNGHIIRIDLKIISAGS